MTSERWRARRRELSTPEGAARAVAEFKAFSRWLNHEDRREIRIDSGLTPTEMARRCQVSRQMLAKLESTADVPDKDALIRYVDLLDELAADPTVRARLAERREARAKAEERRHREWLDEVTGICGHSIQEWQAMRRAAGLPT